LLSFLRMRRPPRSTLFLHDALPIYPSRDPGNRLSRRSGSPGLVGDPNGGKHVPHRLTSQPASITNQEEVIAMQLIQGNLRTVLLTLTLAMTLLLAAAVPSFAAEQPKLRSEEHTSELQSRENLVCRLLLEKKKGDTRIAMS